MGAALIALSSVICLCENQSSTAKEATSILHHYEILWIWKCWYLPKASKQQICWISRTKCQISLNGSLYQLLRFYPVSTISTYLREVDLTQSQIYNCEQWRPSFTFVALQRVGIQGLIHRSSRYLTKPFSQCSCWKGQQPTVSSKADCKQQGWLGFIWGKYRAGVLLHQYMPIESLAVEQCELAETISETNNSDTKLV